MKAPRVRVRYESRSEGGKTVERPALIDTGADVSVLPDGHGEVTCPDGFVDMIGKRYWGHYRMVNVSILGTACATPVEAFVPDGVDPRRKRTDERPRRLAPVGRMEDVIGHRFLEAAGGALVFGKREGITCRRENADPAARIVSTSMKASTVMRVVKKCR